MILTYLLFNSDILRNIALVITSVLMGTFLVYVSHHKLKTLPFFIYIFLIGPADFSTNH
jgi:hypothetical protein